MPNSVINDLHLNGHSYRKDDSHQQSNQDSQTNDDTVTTNKYPQTPGEDAKYWQSRYDKLLSDYNHLQNINQNLEEKLLNVVETFEKKREELVANIEHEKTTLMADVNKLSTKLVDARIKLHDYEEKELIHASECNAPCHRNCPNSFGNKVNGASDQAYDPNLV